MSLLTPTTAFTIQEGRESPVGEEVGLARGGPALACSRRLLMMAPNSTCGCAAPQAIDLCIFECMLFMMYTFLY